MQFEICSSHCPSVAMMSSVRRRRKPLKDALSVDQYIMIDELLRDAFGSMHGHRKHIAFMIHRSLPRPVETCSNRQAQKRTTKHLVASMMLSVRTENELIYAKTIFGTSSQSPLSKNGPKRPPVRHHPLKNSRIDFLCPNE